MELNIIRSVEEFRRLESQWNELLSVLDPAPLPLTHGWLRAWLGAFLQSHAVEFRWVCSNGVCVGIAPFIRESQLYRGTHVSVLTLAANGHSPFSDIIVDPRLTADERHRVYSLLTAMTDKELGVFFKIDRHGELFRFLAGPSMVVAGARKLGLKPGLKTPVIHIDRDWDAFWASRPRKLKKSLNNKLNRFHKHPSFHIDNEVITAWDQPVIQQLIDVSARSWKAGIGNDLESRAEARLFLKGLIEAFGSEGHVNAWVLSDAGRPVAFELHLVLDGIVYPIRADFDDCYRAHSPGSVLEYTILKNLFESGAATVYYTCADDYWYLSNWTSDYREHCTVESFGRGPRLRWLYFVEYSVIPRVKRLLRMEDRRQRIPDRTRGSA